MRISARIPENQMLGGLHPCSSRIANLPVAKTLLPQSFTFASPRMSLIVISDVSKTYSSAGYTLLAKKRKTIECETFERALL